MVAVVVSVYLLDHVPGAWYLFYFYFIISELDVVNTGSRFNCALLIPQAPPKEKKLWFHPLLLFFHPDTNNNNDTNSANIKSCYTIFFTTCTRLLSSVIYVYLNNTSPDYISKNKKKE